jgi:cytochrome P450
MTTTMPEFDTLDYYSAPGLISDPYPYFEYLRSKGPVTQLPNHQAVAVTGYAEALEVLKDTETYSSINAVLGPVAPAPFAFDAEDISDQIEAWRPIHPTKDQIVSFDAPRHGPARALMMRLFTPSRLKANSDYLWTLSDQLIDTFHETGRLEVVRGYGMPFAGMVIADLLGVPEEDRPGFAGRFGVGINLPSVEATEKRFEDNPMSFLNDAFTGYIEDRREKPRRDILTELATFTLPGGEQPSVAEVVNVATFLFVAGQGTTARLLAAAMQVIAEDQALQVQLRSEPSKIDDFIEEVLRLEGPVKTSHRLVRKRTRLAGVDLPAGTHVALLNGAINRDPQRFDAPNEFRLGRPKANDHVAFGRGAHTCPGAPLSRTETRISLTRLLARTDKIRLSEEHHGPSGSRRFQYEPTFVLRGLDQLHVEFSPISGDR